MKAIRRRIQKTANCLLFSSAICCLFTASVFAEVCERPGNWLQPATQKIISNTDYLQPKMPPLLLLGEHHANPAHHQWHLALLQHYFSTGEQFVLAMEVFPRRLQPVLNDWVEKRIDEKAFLAAINWESIWGFDLALYWPVFEFVREHGISLIALNVDHALVQEVSRVGWKAVPESEREGLRDPVAPSRDYVKRLAESYRQHGKQFATKQDDLVAFRNFVDQQLLWDNAMAQGLAALVAAYPSKKIVGIVGSWHLIDRQGVPYQLQAMSVGQMQSWIPWDENLDCEDINAGFSDGIYFPE